MDIIRTERLRLRPIEMFDREAVFAYRSDAISNSYQGFVPKDIQEVDAFISKQPEEWNKPDSWFQLVIIESSTEELIGDIGVHFLADENQCELGCTLRKSSHGKGYAVEAMEAIISHLFERLKKHRISASVDPRNNASIRMLERLGFQKEAHFKEAVSFKGEWVDDLVYGLLHHEWKK